QSNSTCPPESSMVSMMWSPPQTPVSPVEEGADAPVLHAQTVDIHSRASQIDMCGRMANNIDDCRLAIHRQSTICNHQWSLAPIAQSQCSDAWLNTSGRSVASM